MSAPAKPYLIVTGVIFALIALAHVGRVITEWRRFAEDPWFVLEGPGLGVVAGALAFWAWRLIRRSSGQGTPPRADRP